MISRFVQTYASNYTGHARISRMLFIAEHGPGTQMQLEALKIAAEEARQARCLPSWLREPAEIGTMYAPANQGACAHLGAKVHTHDMTFYAIMVPMP